MNKHTKQNMTAALAAVITLTSAAGCGGTEKVSPSPPPSTTAAAMTASQVKYTAAATTTTTVLTTSDTEPSSDSDPAEEADVTDVTAENVTADEAESSENSDSSDTTVAPGEELRESADEDGSAEEPMLPESEAEPETEIVNGIEKRKVPMVLDLSRESGAAYTDIHLYYIDGGDIPYVCASEYIPFLLDNVITGGETEVQNASESVIQAVRKDLNTAVSIDAEKDEIIFEDYDLFLMNTRQRKAGSLVSYGSDHGEADAVLFDTGRSYDRLGGETAFKLSGYDIDIIARNDDVYIPFSTINDILAANKHFLISFDGKKAVCADKFSEYFTERSYVMSEEFARFNYNELKFVLDSFYGLKAERYINDLDEFFMQTGLDTMLSDTASDTEYFGQVLNALVGVYLNDTNSIYVSLPKLVEITVIENETEPETEEADEPEAEAEPEAEPEAEAEPETEAEPEAEAEPESEAESETETEEADEPESEDESEEVAGTEIAMQEAAEMDNSTENTAEPESEDESEEVAGTEIAMQEAAEMDNSTENTAEPEAEAAEEAASEPEAEAAEEAASEPEAEAAEDAATESESETSEPEATVESKELTEVSGTLTLSKDLPVVENVYAEKGDTAYISLNFMQAADTAELIKFAQAQITREGSPVKNVVIDLSQSRGEDVDSAALAVSWCLGTADFALRNMYTGAESVMSRCSDINADGVIDGLDMLPQDIKLFCLISQGTSSCGELTAAALKSTRATLIGTHTGGGCCSVMPVVTPSGHIFCMSGPSRIGILRNGLFYADIYGTEPDVPINDLTVLSDIDKLDDLIHSIK